MSISWRRENVEAQGWRRHRMIEDKDADLDVVRRSVIRWWSLVGGSPGNQWTAEIEWAAERESKSRTRNSLVPGAEGRYATDHLGFNS